MSSPAKILSQLELSSDADGARREAREQGRPLGELVAPGRLVELCGEARTSAAVSVLAAVQREGETAAWIQPARGELYPPDLRAAGVDVEALVVIHVPPEGSISGPAGQCRAAELLLRSGGFGLVVLDFCRAEPGGSAAWQGRLLGLARQHEARVLILRRDARESLGPLVGVRVASQVERVRGPDSQPDNQNDPPGFCPRTPRLLLRHEVLKNKSGGPLEPAPERIRGPWGLL